MLVKKEELFLNLLKQYQESCPDELLENLMIKVKVFELGQKIELTAIFVQSGNSASMVHHDPGGFGFEVRTVQGALKLDDRDKIVKVFKDRSTQALNSTDLLARGFDEAKVNFLKKFDLLVRYDTPNEKDAELYLHRIGRDGEFGRMATVFNMFVVKTEMQFESHAAELENLVARDGNEVEIQDIIVERVILSQAFKRLNENTHNIAHVDAHIAILASIGDVSKLAVKEMTSWAPLVILFLGKAGTGLEVLDTLGSSMTNLNANSGFVSNLTSRGNKVFIITFEVASTIAKCSNLMQSLYEEIIQFLKKEMLHSEGGQQLVSTDTKELLSIAADYKRLNLDPASNKQLREEADIRMLDLTSLQHTSESYHEFHALDKFEQDFRRKLEEVECLYLPRKGRKHMILLVEVRSLPVVN